MVTLRERERESTKVPRETTPAPSLLPLSLSLSLSVMKFCQPIPQSLHYSLFFHVCFTNTMPLFSKEFCSRTSLESGDVITPPYCKKKFTTKKHWENTSKHNSKQQNKMVASRPRSPPVVAAAAVGAVCLEKRKDNEKSFCGADGGTTHHIHTPRAFLRRWIFRVCACSLVLAGRYLLVALLIVDSFCPLLLSLDQNPT